MYSLVCSVTESIIPTNVLPRRCGRPNRASTIQICETVVDIVVNQLFKCIFLPAELSQSCGCISKLPVTLSHAPLKINWARDIFRRYFWNSIMPAWPQMLQHTSLKIRPAAWRSFPAMMLSHQSIRTQFSCHFRCHKLDRCIFLSWNTMTQSSFAEVNPQKWFSPCPKLIKSHDNVTLEECNELSKQIFVLHSRFVWYAPVASHCEALVTLTIQSKNSPCALNQRLS